MAGDARARLVRLTAVAVALTVALSTTTEPVSALFFRVKEGSVRCFLEEVPKDTLVVGDYKSPDTKGGATAKVRAAMGAGLDPSTRHPRRRSRCRVPCRCAAARLIPKHALWRSLRATHFVL